MFLVISCPCALVLSVPLSFFGGLGDASRSGILVKGSNYLEILAQTQTVVFDKTGTLTKGTFSVTAVQPDVGTEAELLELAALAESYSSHLIALSLRQAWGGQADQSRVGQVEEISGHGVRAVIDGRAVLLGSQRLMEQEGIAVRSCDLLGTVIYVAADGVYQGAIVISDTLKEEAPETIRRLKARGIRTVMLTGDRKAVGEAVADQLGIDQVYTELLPEDKVNKVKELLAEKTGKGKLAFVGDGINDAPVLAHADLGIAMGAMGSDAAIEAADVVLMDDDPLKLIPAMEISRTTNRIVLQNIVFVLGVKAVVLGLGLFGMANLWEAVFADVGVLVIAVLNAMRGLKAQDTM